MRGISPELQNNINKLEQVTYLFEIRTIGEKTLYLTSSSRKEFYNDHYFLPKSGLTLEEYYFNDSAQNYIILKGIFEKDGIEKDTKILGSQVKIIAQNNNLYNHILTYFCNSYNKEDLNFVMRLEPESNKYYQTVVQSFSKTCRTVFGDERCKVDRSQYIYQYRVEEIGKKYIKVCNMDKENGYFTGGEIYFSPLGPTFKILKHHQDIFELAEEIPTDLKNVYFLSAITGCDKKFITCCNKFNNAVNFRGEPFIPDSNFLKIGLFK